MEQYIPKSAVVAEIERLITPECGYSMNKLIEFLDTLEVKEEDLNEYINKYFKGWYVDLTDQGNILHTPDGNAGLMSVKEVAKYFFELGLKAQKGEKMSGSDCPYFSETAPVCDDGECGCFECLERIAELKKKGE